MMPLKLISRKRNGKHKIREMVYFLLTGLFCAWIDIILFIVLWEKLLDAKIAGASSFLLASVVNFFLSSIVFNGRKKILVKQILLFTFVIFVGWLITWICIGLAAEQHEYVVYFSKVFSSFLVMIWGYWARKRLVFGKG